MTTKKTMMDRETLSTHGYARRHTPLCNTNQSQDWLPWRFSHLEGDQQRPGRKQTGHQARSQDTWASILVSLCNRKAEPPPPLDLMACPHSEVARTPSLCLFTTGEGASVIAGYTVAQRPTAALPPSGGFHFPRTAFSACPGRPLGPSASQHARLPCPGASSKLVMRFSSPKHLFSL